MPITPVHAWPAIAIKAKYPDFSFTAFFAMSVFMDAEVIMNVSSGCSYLHGGMHSIGWLLLVPFVGYWLGGYLAAFLGGLTHVGLDALMHSDMGFGAVMAQYEPWYTLANLGLLLASVLLYHLMGRGFTKPDWKHWLKHSYMLLIILPLILGVMAQYDYHLSGLGGHASDNLPQSCRWDSHR